jgi:hypothetical protein
MTNTGLCQKWAHFPAILAVLENGLNMDLHWPKSVSLNTPRPVRWMACEWSPDSQGEGPPLPRAPPLLLAPINALHGNFHWQTAVDMRTEQCSLHLRMEPKICTQVGAAMETSERGKCLSHLKHANVTGHYRSEFILFLLTELSWRINMS